jgi:hypothetical protein
MTEMKSVMTKFCNFLSITKGPKGITVAKKAITAQRKLRCSLSHACSSTLRVSLVYCLGIFFPAVIIDALVGFTCVASSQD